MLPGNMLSKGPSPLSAEAGALLWGASEAACKVPIGKLEQRGFFYRTNAKVYKIEV